MAAEPHQRLAAESHQAVAAAAQRLQTAAAAAAQRLQAAAAAAAERLRVAAVRRRVARRAWCRGVCWSPIGGHLQNSGFFPAGGFLIGRFSACGGKENCPQQCSNGFRSALTKRTSDLIKRSELTFRRGSATFLGFPSLAFFLP